jgi:hypothetical protein
MEYILSHKQHHKSRVFAKGIQRLLKYLNKILHIPTRRTQFSSFNIFLDQYFGLWDVATVTMGCHDQQLQFQTFLAQYATTRLLKPIKENNCITFTLFCCLFYHF